MPAIITTTIAKSAAQAGLTFVSSNIVVTGNVAPYVETNVVNGTPETINISLDANLNFFYALSERIGHHD